MKTKEEIKKEIESLNETELYVYNACIKEAIASGDEGNEFAASEISVENLTYNQVKGYLSQLTQKGLLIKLEDSYFDFIVTELQ